MPKQLSVLISVLVFLSSPLSVFGSKCTMDDIQFMAKSSPPYVFEEKGELQGIATDLLEKMLEKSGFGKNRKDFILAPGARAYHTILNEDDICVFPLTRTSERENLFKWVGPIAPCQIVLLAKKTNHIVIKSFSDLNRYRIGVVRDDVGQHLLTENGIAKEKLEIVNNPILNIQKMVQDRIDLWVHAEVVAYWLLKENQLNPDDFEAVYTLKKGGYYFAFSINIDDEIISKFQQVFEDIITEGVQQKIIDHYLKNADQ